MAQEERERKIGEQERKTPETERKPGETKEGIRGETGVGGPRNIPPTGTTGGQYGQVGQVSKLNCPDCGMNFNSQNELDRHGREKHNK